MITSRAGSGAVVLGYHDIDATESRGWTVSAKMLDRHLTTLGRSGHSIVPLTEIVDRLETDRPVDGLAAITFDDALLGVHRHGLPVLDAHGVRATVFVVTDHLGVDPPWWPGAERTLDSHELHSIVAAGHDLGSHTASHRSLVDLPTGELGAELADSRERVRTLLGRYPDVLAYPSGHHDPAVRQAVEDAGFRAAVTFLNGRVTSRCDHFRLPRLTMGDHQSTPRFLYHLLRPAGSWPNHQLDHVRG